MAIYGCTQEEAKLSHLRRERLSCLTEHTWTRFILRNLRTKLSHFCTPLLYPQLRHSCFRILVLQSFCHWHTNVRLLTIVTAPFVRRSLHPPLPLSTVPFVRRSLCPPLPSFIAPFVHRSLCSPFPLLINFIVYRSTVTFFSAALFVCHSLYVFLDLNNFVHVCLPFVTSHVGDSGENNPPMKDKAGKMAESHAKRRQ